MKNIIFLLSLLYSTLSFSSVCILNFERPDSFNTLIIDRVFANEENVKIVHLAKPLHIIECVKENYEEIIIAAHGTYNPETPEKKSKLIYYTELTTFEKQKYKADAESLAKEYDELKHRSVRKTGGHRKVIKNEEYKRWEVVTGFLEDLENGKIFYKRANFHNVVFKRVLKVLHSQDLKGSPKLRKIRIASCLEDSLKERYSAFEEIEQKYGIEFDWLPENKLGTWIKGIQSAQLTSEWLEESLK